MKFSSISFFIRIRENFRGYSSFSGNPFNFADFPVPGTLLNGKNDIPTPTFLSSILTITGAIRSRDELVEDEDVREEMMEKKTVGEGFAMEVFGEEDDLAAVDGAAWCEWLVEDWWRGWWRRKVLAASMEDSRSDGSGHGGSRLTMRLMVVKIGFGDDDKVGGSSGKVGGDGIRVSEGFEGVEGATPDETPFSR
ncbi:hypothetical protein V8G54_035042 [Vigna mungo]|uniref:Uncharacterized protein n=1 Tax=Vigna mungo TaxID=3915 RepID=A0AAQ3MEZ6_VIGMU